jgi:subtilase family serine protease
VGWLGYKVHLTETCEAHLLLIITHVETTLALVSDDAMTATIHAELERKELVPAQHLSAEYGIHLSQLYRWKDQVLVGLPNLFNEQAEKNLREKEAEWQNEREALYAEIGRLTTEKTWLEKKSRTFSKER